MAPTLTGPINTEHLHVLPMSQRISIAALPSRRTKTDLQALLERNRHNPIHWKITSRGQETSCRRAKPCITSCLDPLDLFLSVVPHHYEPSARQAYLTILTMLVPALHGAHVPASICPRPHVVLPKLLHLHQYHLLGSTEETGRVAKD